MSTEVTSPRDGASPEPAAAPRPARTAVLRRVFSRWESWVGGALIALLLFCVLFGRLVAPYDANATNPRIRFQPPSAEHWFGTDEVGRDVLSRILVGSGYTLTAAVAVVLSGVVLGSIVGLVAGYLGGAVDNVLMRITDLFISFPALLLAIAVAAALGQGLVQTCIALGVVIWAGYARITRGQVAALRTRLYVDAARLGGASNLDIVRRHIAPNALSPVLVKATMDVALAVEWIAALGFIGLGAKAPMPEWGATIAVAKTYISSAWWYIGFTSLALVVTVLGFNLIGDGVSKALYKTETRR